MGASWWKQILTKAREAEGAGGAGEAGGAEGARGAGGAGEEEPQFFFSPWLFPYIGFLRALKLHIWELTKCAISFAVAVGNRLKKSPTVNSQQSTVNSQQSTVNSQQSTANSQQSTVNSQQSTVNFHHLKESIDLFSKPYLLLVAQNGQLSPNSPAKNWRSCQ
ncbi:MAG: hypothetical protein F6K31_35430 [Symploca sp. SIO2G7]|nr:hypothetical protein [Symploca sp. SIO2G7]